MKITKTEVTTDLVVTRSHKDSIEVILIRRRNDPFKGKWALPGGFVETDEEVTMAAVRELREETGLKVKEEDLNFIDYFDAPDRDPRGRLISFAFKVEVGPKVTIKAGDDAGEVEWFSLVDLPDLAFDHQTIIARSFEQ